MGRRGPQPVPFWDHVAVCGPDDCWEWTGTCFTNGYGRATVDRRSVGAHRRAYELSVGPIPAGLKVLHTCDNPPCVNPSHLFAGTTKDNAEDMVTKGRSARGARNANAILTDDAVRDIRARYAAGGVTQKELADEYGVVEGAVWNVLHGQSWAEVA